MKFEMPTQPSNAEDALRDLKAFMDQRAQIIPAPEEEDNLRLVLLGQRYVNLRRLEIMALGGLVE